MKSNCKCEINCCMYDNSLEINQRRAAEREVEVLRRQSQFIIEEYNIAQRSIMSLSAYRLKIIKLKDSFEDPKEYESVLKGINEKIKYLLDQLTNIPELWLYDPNNKEIVDELKEALNQKAYIYRGSFSKYLEEA